MNKDMKFEQAIEILEAEVKRLEEGNMTLDESLSAYENAVKLSRICNEKLDRAEACIRVLTEGADGTVTDKPFLGKNDEA